MVTDLGPRNFKLSVRAKDGFLKRQLNVGAQIGADWLGCPLQ